MGRMSLFVAGLSHLSRKEGRAAMLIGDMDLSRLLVYVQQVEKEKLRDREEFRNKKAKTGNESRIQQKQKGSASSSASAPAPRNKDRASPIGATFGTGERAIHLYAITSLQEQDDSPNVVTGHVVRFNHCTCSVHGPYE
ncbi:uncharacterized protein LOC125829567 [Solanum verrucosum]|uniref:uncharacterized protein LOC125829567 n=1 Tax=Solanum verrucosum TaxID=315347 RepID=UPI0020D06C4A|nr:uncharacterized protein LOC125829567 [Solanum verrucosum]